MNILTDIHVLLQINERVALYILFSHVMAEARTVAANQAVFQEQTANMSADIKHRSVNAEQLREHNLDRSQLDSGSNEGEDDTGHAGSVVH